MPEEKTTLTEGEVNQVLNAWNFLEFADSYRKSYFGNSYFTPDTVNQQMKNINMNPRETTIAGLEAALKDPKSNEEVLRNYATYLENTNMYYKRLLRYFPDMAAFNLTFDCINLKKEEEMDSPAFKKDLKILDEFCSSFDFKEEFAKVFRQLMRQGVYFSVFRDEGAKKTLQELPPDFCKITGRHEYGLLFDFNMQWFIGNFGVDIDMYPKVFKKMLNRVYFQNGIRTGMDYDPAGIVDKRKSSYVFWHQCSPKDGFWCWKISPEIATIIPYFMPLFPDLSFQPIIRGLQQDEYFIAASKLLVGVIGFNKDTKSGQVANQFNITPEVLGQFLGVARQGLNRQIGLVALPVDKIEAVEFEPPKSNMSTDAINNTVKQSVASSDILFTEQKLNSHQSKLASQIDMNFVEAIYPIFSDFIEYMVNSQTKKYKFRIAFHDENIPDQKTERLSKFKDLASMGFVDGQLLARSCDMTIFELGRSLDLTKSMGLDKKLMPLLSLNNQSPNSAGGTGDGPGRPKIDSPDNENTEASQARGSNELKVD